jgi:hypothetical protein
MTIGVTSPVHRWLTAADAPDSVPAELSDLGAHMLNCNGCRGRWFALRCAVDALHGFVATRFVTTLLIASAAMGLVMAFAL